MPIAASGERDLGGAPWRAGEDGLTRVPLLGAAHALALQQDAARRIQGDHTVLQTTIILNPTYTTKYYGSLIM